MTQQATADATQIDATGSTGWRPRDWLVITIVVWAGLPLGQEANRARVAPPAR